MESIAIKPRRRWFRFGLRTMFVVVTVLSLWLGWQTKIVRERKEEIAQLRKNGALIAGQNLVDVDLPTIPLWRTWIGDEAYSSIDVPSKYSDSDMKRLCRLFPESVYIMRANEERHAFDAFRVSDAASPDAAYFAKKHLRQLIWPSLAIAAFFAWEVARVIRGSLAETKLYKKTDAA